MKKRSITFCYAFIIIAAVACNSEAKKSVKTDTIDQVSATEQKSMPTSPLVELKSFSGKYPNEISLLENVKLKPRIEKLLGNKYNDFVKYWNTETPIVIEKEVLSTTGCEQHNCGGNSYLLYIDLANDNINVFHILNGKIESFLEKGEIKFPTALQKEFEVIKGNLEI